MSLIGSLIGAGTTLLTQYQNQRNQEKQNEFNANEAAKNRNFQAEQAQLARDYQTEFYETYQSPSAMVRQYKDAGMNPALMAGGYNPPSAVSTSIPSGSAASAASPNYQSVSSMIEAIGSMAMLKAQIDNVKADTSLKRAESEKLGSDIELNNQNISESQNRIRKLIAETKSEGLKQGLITAQEILTKKDAELKGNQSISISFDNLKKQFELSYKDKYGFYPSNNVTEAVLQILGQSVAEIEYYSNKLLNFGKNLFK